jgi:hypothetical protein
MGGAFPGKQPSWKAGESSGLVQAAERSPEGGCKED